VLEKYSAEIGRGSGYLMNILVASRGNGVRVTSIPVHCEDRRESRYNLMVEGAYRFGHVFWVMLRRLSGQI